jgi:pyruvate-ferredoxin/flavodoxin oxidoreductase
VLASGRNVNVLVLDTEVYSNTGGQQSKATPLGATAKFAEAGKETPKKDLGLLAMSYGNVYVARIAFGAKMSQTVQVLQEAESYPGPSLVIAYSHCIAHGYDMAQGAEQQKLAVASGTWPLYRFDPRRSAAGQPSLQLDSVPPKVDVLEYMRNESRFRMVEKESPERFQALVARAREVIREREAVYRHLAGLTVAAAAPATSGGA